MERWSENIIYYPQLAHPLHNERGITREKYMALLKKYAVRYEREDLIDIKLQVVYKALYGKQEGGKHWDSYSQQIDKEVLRTRFFPFKIFSYRYIFLFDCLLLFAVTDEEKGKQICDDIKACVHSRYHKKIDGMVLKMYEGDRRFAIKTLISDEMVCAWSDARQFNASREQEIVFTATMSAGKSTLINAIMGHNLSETKMAACTSTVIKFHSAPIKNNLYTIIDGKPYYFFEDPDYVRNYMKDRKTSFEVCSYFDSLFCNRKITLTDTPGIDSALNTSHKDVTRSKLTGRKIEKILYVIPVETYGSKADYNHLTYIKKEVSYDKIIFAVNMVDRCDMENDSIKDILQEIQKHLENIGFSSPVVCPVSAKAGLQLKRLLNGAELSDNERRSAEIFRNLFLKEEFALAEYYPHIDESEVKDLRSRFSGVCDDELWKAYVNTGLPGLEKILYDL